MRFRAYGQIVVICLAPWAITQADEISGAIVKVEVSSRKPDLVRPWAKRNSEDSSGSGVILEGRRILTNAHVVDYARQVFLRLNQSSDLHPARVLAVARGMDLALLQLEQPDKLDGRPWLTLRPGIPSLKQTVNVYGYPLGGDQHAVTEGIVSRIEYGAFASDTMGLRIQIDAALNPGNSGGPAIVDGQIVGLVFSRINEAENIGYLIPSEEIERFLKDVQDGEYSGVPTIFDELQTVENDALRGFLGMSQSQSGMMLTRARSVYPDYPLRPWDVITHIAGEPIDNEGRIRVRDDLRLDFRYRIPQVIQNGKVPLTVWRNRESLEILVPLQVEPNLVLPPLDGAYPEYFVYGPLVFMPAYQDLFTVLGSQGVGYLLTTRNPVLRRFRDDRAFADEELVVCRSLSHRLTKGYDNLYFVNLLRLNDQPIKNLRHLVTLLRDSRDEFLVFEFAGMVEHMVFRRTELESVTEDIQDEEGIRERGSPDLIRLWNARQEP